LNVLDNWRSTVGFTLTPVVLVLVTMLAMGHFSRVPKEELEKVQAELAQARQSNERLRTEGTFYLEQVRTYRKKFPKAKAYFPEYIKPAAAPVTDQD
jgi:Tfp pilus assembly protein PilE